MITNFKKIHIGKMIRRRVWEKEMESSRICRLFGCTEKEIMEMYEAENLYPDVIMKWCRLLDYDFFRIYSQHLILYAPIVREKYGKSDGSPSVPYFRKNIYTREIIDFILDLLEKEEKTKEQIMDEYNIPKTTLYKWIQKYND